MIHDARQDAVQLGADPKEHAAIRDVPGLVDALANPLFFDIRVTGVFRYICSDDGRKVVLWPSAADLA